MKTVTVRDLHHDFQKVEGLLRQGEQLRVSKRGRVIARLAPEPARRKLPDFQGRMKGVYGDTLLAATGAEVVRADRDE